MDIKAFITYDKDVLGGQQVFTGTRVPIETLFDHLEAGVSLDVFLADFPTVSKEQAIAVLDYEDAIPEEHKQILDSRINAFESGHAKTIEWEEAKKRLSGNK